MPAVHATDPTRSRLKVTVTRRLPEAVETRMSELFDVSLNADDHRMSREELVAATRALDRVLLWNFYFVPQWHNPDIWVAFWDKFGIPDDQPDYVGVDLDSWWIIPQREVAIEEEFEEDE